MIKKYLVSVVIVLLVCVMTLAMRISDPIAVDSFKSTVTATQSTSLDLHEAYPNDDSVNKVVTTPQISYP